MKLKTERDYQEFAKIGRRLGVPVFEAFLTLETFDKNGKRTSYHKQRSHSWTRNAYNLMFMQLASKDGDDATTFGGGYLNFKKTSGTVVNQDRPGSIVSATSSALYSADTPGGSYCGYLAGAGDDTSGIQVGTGTGAESFEDYVLGTLIANGNAATQLAYGAHETHAETYTAGTKTYEVDIVRYFNNNSGGSITVNEIGLVANGAMGATANCLVMVARDKLGTGVAVADTGQLKVTYTISLVFGG